MLVERQGRANRWYLPGAVAAWLALLGGCIALMVAFPENRLPQLMVGGQGVPNLSSLMSSAEVASGGYGCWVAECRRRGWR